MGALRPPRRRGAAELGRATRPRGGGRLPHLRRAGCRAALPPEARPIGKKAVKAAKATKDQDDKIKSRARSNKGKARKAAATDAERAAALPARLAELDAACIAARAELWGARVELPLPDPHAPIVESTLPPLPPPWSATETAAWAAALAATMAWAAVLKVTGAS